MKKEVIVTGYAYPFIDPFVLSYWLPALTYLNVFSYGISREGELVPLNDESLIRTAKIGGAMPLMVITPMDETGMFNEALAAYVVSTAERRQALIDAIKVNIETKGLGGVDFDFEYVPVGSRDNYSTLVSEAREQLNPLGYVVTVALAPKTSAEQKGLLYEGHDYGAMGAAANYALLMTYEWGYTFGPPLAVSPINQMRRVLDYGVTEIPREKILMGMPNYGYDWKLPFVQGKSQAEKISNEEAAARARRYGVNVQYDMQSQAPNYTYYDSEGIQHQVWFENENSIRAKLALVEEYDLAGVGFWNIMNYPMANRTVLEEMYQIVKV